MLNFSHFKNQLPGEVDIRVSVPLTSGTYIRTTTLFPSRKNHTSLTCETLAQTHACLYFEQDPRTAAYLTRPFSLYSKRLKRGHKADVLTRDVDGSYCVYLINEPEGPGGVVSARRDLMEEELKLIAVTTSRLDITAFASHVKLRNLRYLYHHAYEGSAEGAASVALLLQRTPGSATIKTLQQQGGGASDIAYALFHRMMATNLERPLTPDSHCWMLEHANS